MYDPDLSRMEEEAIRDFKERMSRMSPEKRARVHARVMREIVEAQIESEAGEPLACTHPKDDALHEEVILWSEGWAKRLHDECPIPMGEQRGEHEEREVHALVGRHEEIAASCPERFAGCALARPTSIHVALFYGLHRHLRSATPTKGNT